jgi:hypothetical protein
MKLYNPIIFAKICNTSSICNFLCTNKLHIKQISSNPDLRVHVKKNDIAARIVNE